MRRVVPLLVFAAIVLLGAGAAGAHTELSFSVPEEGEDVTEPFDEITLVFLTEILDGSIELIDPAGEVVPTDGPADVGEEEVSQRFDLIPEPGTYTVRSGILAADGDFQSWEYEFSYSGPQERASRGSGSNIVTLVGLIVGGVVLVAGVFYLAGRGRSREAREGEV